MKKLFLVTVLFSTIKLTAIGQCTALYSFAAYFNTVSFFNQSSVSNPHYFWNFGDGTGSNSINPIHTFPETGDYLVTLFAKDTISNCSAYYEYWVNVTKYSPDPCQPSISDSIYTSFGNTELSIYNTSTNCNLFQINYTGGLGCNFPTGLMPIHLWPTTTFHMVCIGQYHDSYGNLKREAYRTAIYNYSSSHNYGDCSANFEFKVVSKDSSGQRILFTAMNKTATFYEWYISGFGNPIISNYDTISQWFPINPCLGIVGLFIQGSSGCRDSIFQNILTYDSAETVTGVNKIEQNNVVGVYPNPNKGSFTISLSNAGQQDRVEIYNVLGERVYEEPLKKQNNNSIELTSQPSGIYFYRVLSETGLVGEGKLVIEK